LAKRFKEFFYRFSSFSYRFLIIIFFFHCCSNWIALKNTCTKDFYCISFFTGLLILILVALGLVNVSTCVIIAGKWMPGNWICARHFLEAVQSLLAWNTDNKQMMIMIMIVMMMYNFVIRLIYAVVGGRRACPSYYVDNFHCAAARVFIFFLFFCEQTQGEQLEVNIVKLRYMVEKYLSKYGNVSSLELCAFILALLLMLFPTCSFCEQFRFLCPTKPCI
jgi:hypothetical protein